MNATTHNRFKPGFDALEDRFMPATCSVANGVLTVTGTNQSETITLRQSADVISVDGACSYYSSGISSVRVNALAGNDFINLHDGGVRLPSVLDAGTGNDTVWAGRNNDSLYGNWGLDLLWGGEGDDVVVGGPNNDKLYGYGGYDYLYGEGGHDFLDDGNRSYQEYADGGAGSDFNADIWVVNGARYTDIRQRNAPTCSFLAAASAVSRTRDLSTYISYQDDGYRVWLFKSGYGWRQFTVQFSGNWNADGSINANDPMPAQEGESWVIIMQRAYQQMRGDDGRSWPNEALLALTAQNSYWDSRIDDADQTTIRTALANNRAVLAATQNYPDGALIANHTYTVVAMSGSGSSAYVLVRNPWGYDGGTSTDANAGDGLVWLRWGTFKASMAHGFWIG